MRVLHDLPVPTLHEGGPHPLKLQARPLHRCQEPEQPVVRLHRLSRQHQVQRPLQPTVSTRSQPSHSYIGRRRVVRRRSCKRHTAASSDMLVTGTIRSDQHKLTMINSGKEIKSCCRRVSARGQGSKARSRHVSMAKLPQQSFFPRSYSTCGAIICKWTGAASESSDQDNDNDNDNPHQAASRRVGGKRQPKRCTDVSVYVQRYLYCRQRPLHESIASSISSTLGPDPTPRNGPSAALPPAEAPPRWKSHCVGAPQGKANDAAHEPVFFLSALG